MNLKMLLRILVTVGLLGWLILRTDALELREALSHTRLGLWMAALGLYMAIQIISGLRWQLLSKPLGFERSVGQCIRFYFVGMFFNLFLPTSVGGDVIRAWSLDGGSGRKTKAFVSVLVDRSSGLVVLLVLACLGLILSPISVEHWIAASVWCIAGLTLVGLILAPWLLVRARMFDRFRSLTEPLAVYFKLPQLMLLTTFLSLVIQAGNVVLVRLVGLAIGVAIPSSYYWIMVPLVTLLTMLPISLNGMGIREGSTILFLTPLGVNHATALSLAVLWFAVFTTASLFGGLLYLLNGLSKPASFQDTEMEWKAAA
jgi:uncharacterized membrane protein YbhN (UPF0104 family)